MKRKLKLFLFYFISFTWGFIMSFIGLVAILFSIPFKRVHKFHGRLYAVWGKGWGGVELGCFFICSSDCQTDHLRGHECGHGLQNCLWGPLMPFVICIPSAIRYWYRELAFYRRGKYPKTAYDDIWFEGQATRWGQKYIITDKY